MPSGIKDQEPGCDGDTRLCGPHGRGPPCLLTTVEPGGGILGRGYRNRVESLCSGFLPDTAWGSAPLHLHMRLYRDVWAWLCAHAGGCVFYKLVGGRGMHRHMTFSQHGVAGQLTLWAERWFLPPPSPHRAQAWWSPGHSHPASDSLQTGIRTWHQVRAELPAARREAGEHSSGRNADR